MNKGGGALHRIAPRHGVVAGALLGVALALAAGALWVVIALLTDSRHPYLMVLVGIAAAYGVYLGTHRPGWKAAVLSVVITFVVLVIATYWVERMLILRWFGDFGDHISIPVVPYFDWIVEVLRSALQRTLTPVLFGVVGLGAAGALGLMGFEQDPAPPAARAASPSRRP